MGTSEAIFTKNNQKIKIQNRAPNTTQENVTFDLYSNTKATSVSSKTLRLLKGEYINVLLHHQITHNETLTVRI